MSNFLGPRVARVLVSAAALSVVLSACGDRTPRIDVKPRAATLSRPGLVAGFPRFGEFAPDDAMPAEEATCRKALDKLGVTWRDGAPISQGACGIAHPVEVSALPGGVALEPAATLNCAMALTFSRWVKKELQPAARKRYFSGVARIRQGAAYSCRNMIGSGGSGLSEHATGNAIDVMAVELNNGKEIDVRKPGLFAFRERGLLNNVRGDACDYFSTVLGPGYNREHKDHFHFDLRPRKNGRIACE